MPTDTLFKEWKLGPIRLTNRIVMAPMTRNRAGEGNVPTPMMAEYYRQRASAGLLITEGSQVTPEGQGYPSTPGIHTREQVQGWKAVTKAVHDTGGRIFLQLWHVGRISHSSYQPGGKPPVAPSAIAPKGKVYTAGGMKPYETPHALTLQEIPAVVEQYRRGAANALEAGFDGVEIHGANGYLIDQFLRDGTNHRTDAYGGSLENRTRFLLEVTRAVISVWGKDRVGVRFSPGGSFNDMKDSHTRETFSYAASELSKLGIVYLHIRESDASDLRHGGEETPTAAIRAAFGGTLIVNGGYDKARATSVLQSAAADLVAFGIPFISNPDLPRRLKDNAPLTPAQERFFYGGEEKGYTDYPALA